MEKAKEKLISGITRTITAEEVDGRFFHTISSKQGRFFCLYCGEEVAFVSRSKENFNPFFRHSNKKSDSDICQERHKVEKYNSIYEKLGLPLYLKKTNDKLYQLNIGFYKIKDKILKKLEEENAEITLRSENNKYSTKFNIDYSRFFSYQTTFIKIDFLASKYNIDYSKSFYKELLLWGEYIEGVANEGAIFKYDSKLCRKLRINDEIYFDTDYILIRDKNLINFIGIEYKEEGLLEINKKFIVYKIRIPGKNKEYYNHLYDFFRINFKLILTVSPINIVPIWPPVLMKDREINNIYEKNTYSIIESHYEETKVYIHNDEDIREENARKLKDNFFSIELLTKSTEQIISLNDKYDNNYYIYGKANTLKLENNIEVSIFDFKGNVIKNGIYFELPIENKVVIKTNSKCEIVIFNKNQIKKSKKIKDINGIIIDDLAYGDNVILINGMEKISLLEFVRRKERLIRNNCDWNELFYKSQKINSYFVTVPPWIFEILKSIPKESRLFIYIKNAVYLNKIQNHVLNLLKEEYERIKDERS